MKQTGAEVLTLQSQLAREEIKRNPSYDLVVLSPGPGNPAQFHLADTIDICLGLQGIVEYFGGTLNILEYPQHGKHSNKCKILVCENEK